MLFVNNADQPWNLLNVWIIRAHCANFSAFWEKNSLTFLSTIKTIWIIGPSNIHRLFKHLTVAYLNECSRRRKTLIYYGNRVSTHLSFSPRTIRRVNILHVNLKVKIIRILVYKYWILKQFENHGVFGKCT